MNDSLMWHFYVRRGFAYVPTVAKTDAGFFVDVPPVSVVALSDRQTLIGVLERAISSGNVSIRTPRRDQYPSVPAVAAAAGLKSWSTFEKGSRCFAIYKTAAGYEIPLLKMADTGGWKEVSGAGRVLSSSTSPVEVATCAVEQITSPDDR